MNLEGLCGEKILENLSAENKSMKTRGAISLVATAESTAQKCTLSTRNIKVIIENDLSKRFTIRYHLKQNNLNSVKIASERARKRERKRVYLVPCFLITSIFFLFF